MTADAMPRRVVVFGASGLFGSAAVERLRADGVAPVVPVRRRRRRGGDSADVQYADADDADSVRRMLRAGDVVLDTVGPFQPRTTALLEAAMAAGADYIDLNDNPDYARRVIALEERIGAAGIRVFTSCSSISVVPATFLRMCQPERAVRATVFLAPESRFAARPGTVETLLVSLHTCIDLPRGGRTVAVGGWSERRLNALPTKRGRGWYYLFNSADYVHLPRAFPSLQTVEFFVNSGIPPADRLLTALVRLDPRGRLLTRLLLNPRLYRPLLPLVRRLGRSGGCISVQVELESGATKEYAIGASSHGYYVPVVPAVIAAERLLEGQVQEKGLVPHDRQVEPAELFAYLKELGYRVRQRAQDG